MQPAGLRPKPTFESRSTPWPAWAVIGEYVVFALVVVAVIGVCLAFKNMNDTCSEGQHRVGGPAWAPIQCEADR
jgi:hypothetical protein